jgi:lysophospholipase L1-like esterase
MVARNNEHRTFHRFVAIGDSTTEGMDDPDGEGGYVGWADRLALRLRSLDPELRYANLAVRGRSVAQVRAEQLASACDQGPDLASVIAGVNDLMRPSCDVTEVIDHLDHMYGTLRGLGATVLTITQPTPAVVMQLARPVHRRLLAYNEGIRECARRHRLVLIDFACIPTSTHPALWSEDRLHLNTLGHTLAEETIAAHLGLVDPPPGEPALPEPASAGRAERLRTHAVWAQRYLAPYLWRHLRGRSSGDGLRPKRPIATPLCPAGRRPDPQLACGRPDSQFACDSQLAAGPIPSSRAAGPTANRLRDAAP